MHVFCLCVYGSLLARLRGLCKTSERASGLGSPDEVHCQIVTAGNFRHTPGEFKTTYYCWSPTAVGVLSFSGLALWFVRSLHIRLLSMHVTAALSQSGNVAKYLLPVSDFSCAVTYRFMLALRILFDVSYAYYLM